MIFHSLTIPFVRKCRSHFTDKCAFIFSSHAIALSIFVTIILILLTILKICAEFRSPSWDWDVDHFLYASSELTKGRLPFEIEPADKFPLVYYMLVPAVMFKSIFLWRIISLALLLMACYSIYKLMNALFMSFSAELNRLISLFSCTVFAFFIVYSYGGITHINNAAISFFATGLHLFVVSSLKHRNGEFERSFDFAHLFLSALCFAAAISIRPYLGFAMVLIIFSINLYPNFVSRDAGYFNLRHLSSRLILTSIYFALLLAITFLSNFWLYIIQNKTSLIPTIIEFLSIRWIPMSVTDIIQRQSHVFYVFEYSPANGIIIFLFVSQLLINLIYFLRKELSPSNKQFFFLLLVLGSISPIMLEMAFLSRHYWPHYQQLFAPFIAINLGSVLMAFCQKKSSRYVSFRLLENLHKLIVSCILVLFLLRYDTIRSLDGVLDPVSKSRELLTADFLISDLTNSKSAELKEGFLYPSSMYIHWRLEQPRHGVPSSAFLEWSTLIETPMDKGLKWRNFSGNEAGLCQAINSSGPPTIIEGNWRWLVDCLTIGANSQYLKSTSELASSLQETFSTSVLVRKT